MLIATSLTAAENASTIVSFENNTSFISQINNTKSTVYWISSSLNRKNSNFVNSPLIVPIFYNFGKLSYQQKQLFYRIDTENKIDINTALDNDKVLGISNSKKSFIPLQQKFQNKVSIITKNQPITAGIYSVLKDSDTIAQLAYNYSKEESLVRFLDLNNLKKANKKITISNSISKTFKEINKKNEVHWLWKWFLSLAIVSLLLEILILKFYKP